MAQKSAAAPGFADSLREAISSASTFPNALSATAAGAAGSETLVLARAKVARQPEKMMKSSNWIVGPMAAVLGLGSVGLPAAQAQQGAVITDVAAPDAAPGAANAGSASALPPLFIWDAQSVGGAQIGAVVGAWGNGVAQSGAGGNGNTLTATVRNLDEGIRFDLKKPVNLAPYRRAGFWRLRVQLAGAQAAGRGRNRGGNATPGGAPASGDAAPLTQLRLKLVLDKGAVTGFIPITQAAGGGRNRGGNGWQNLLLPVRNMVSSSGASGLVRRIILTGDSTASFGIEQVALVAETSDITATVRRASDAVGTDVSDITVKPGQGTTLVADINAGTSDLSVLWNFNADNNPAYPAPAGGQGANAAPGNIGRGNRNVGGGAATPARRIDAIGVSARPNWPNEENDYRVEVTIADRAGKKTAVKKSFLVKVRAGDTP